MGRAQLLRIGEKGGVAGDSGGKRRSATGEHVGKVTSQKQARRFRGADWRERGRKCSRERYDQQKRQENAASQAMGAQEGAGGVGRN